MPFRDLQIINLIIKTFVLLHNFLLTKDDATLHPRHHFQDADYCSREGVGGDKQIPEEETSWADS